MWMLLAALALADEPEAPVLPLDSVVLVQQGQAPGSYVVKILDFGLARLHSRSAAAEGATSESILTAENTVMGTPDFLSPEQARSLHTVDIRSDLYSLGCTFYYLLTGRATPGRPSPAPATTPTPRLIRSCSSSRFDDAMNAVSIEISRF